MRVNFDANASVRPIVKVREFLAQYSGDFLNPSSVHSLGQAAKAVIDEATYEISKLLGLRKTDRIIFTSGASEANNAALVPDFLSKGKETYQLACSNIEHTSVLECLRKYSEMGYGIKEIPVEDLLSQEKITKHLNDELRIFAIMAANNESGQIVDVKQIAQSVRSISARARIHCDAVQALGKYHLNFEELGIDSMSISGHKIGAISGIGALIISEHIQMQPWILGGPQQFGLRAGTENIVGIKTLAIACREAATRLSKGLQNIKTAKQAFNELFAELGDLVVVNKVKGEQLVNTISIRIPGIKADDLVVALDLCSVSVSAGSACASGKPNPSHVLLAQGLSEIEAKETVRISFEPELDSNELQSGLSAFRETLISMSKRRRAA